MTGSAANVADVEQALSESPAIIHFATHVVAAPGEFGSGIIALSLDSHGAIGLMGPKDIAAHRIAGSLVVMDGCHSSRGEALPGSGLMGLTRAWIGAGARAVLSTRWDVPDDTAQTLMVNFYRALGEDPHGNPATALREAQLAALRSTGKDRLPVRWAGYFLLSRI
jgi:CHAT domain-containing protein